MKHIEVVEIVVASLPGANQGDSIRECLNLAVSKWQNVKLKHNGRNYAICPNDILAAIRECP
jgi:hypothetical protein